MDWFIGGSMKSWVGFRAIQRCRELEVKSSGDQAIEFEVF